MPETLEAETHTVAEIAAKNAGDLSMKGRLIGFTGRMLTKASFEEVEFTDDDDPLYRAQFMARELNLWGRLVVGVTANLLREDSDRLTLKRTLALNKMARTGSHPVNVYDGNGLVA